MTRFLLTFDNLDDPAPDEMRRVRERLTSMSVEEVTPGTLAIEGTEHLVRAAVAGLDQWQLHEEKRLSIRPPHRSRL